MFTAQSRQSARLFLQSSELGPPTPSPAGGLCPLFDSGGRDTLSCGTGGGGSPSGRGDRHCGILGIYVLCGSQCLNLFRSVIFMYYYEQDRYANTQLQQALSLICVVCSTVLDIKFKVRNILNIVIA
jgi:hypothetical protein